MSISSQARWLEAESAEALGDFTDGLEMIGRVGLHDRAG
jgi:hypothetical protein